MTRWPRWSHRPRRPRRSHRSYRSHRSHRSYRGSKPAAAGRLAALRRGLRAEQVAVMWLRLKGYTILARRYRTRFGEIDLIGRRGRVLVFAEVKARAAIEAAAEAITPAQQRRIVAAARGFLAKNPALAVYDVRFDAILVDRWRAPHHIVDAWRPME